MNHEVPLVLNVAVALAIAVAGGFLASWLRQLPIFGYLLAGVAIGPFTPGFVGNREQIELLAGVGVIFLMFGLGVAFSLTGPGPGAGHRHARHLGAGGIDNRRGHTGGPGDELGHALGVRVRDRAGGQQLHGDPENIA